MKAKVVISRGGPLYTEHQTGDFELDLYEMEACRELGKMDKHNRSEVGTSTAFLRNGKFNVN